MESFNRRVSKSHGASHGARLLDTRARMMDEVNVQEITKTPGDPISSYRIDKKTWPQRINTDKDGAYIAKRKELKCVR